MIDSIDNYYRNYEHDDSGNEYIMREILRFIPDNGCRILDIGCILRPLGTGHDGIPFENNKFDIVYSSMLLEYIFNFKDVLAEIYQVLKSNSRVFIEVPNVHYWPNRFLMFCGRELIWIGIGKHIRAFNQSNLARSLKKVGFKEIKIIRSILPIPKTNLKVHFPFFNRVLPGLCYSLIAYAQK